MRIILNHTSIKPIHEQLTEQIRNAIVNGELKENDALPSVRTLAAELRISSLTVKKAYDHLEEERLIVTVHGKGSCVAASDQSFSREARRLAVENELAVAVQHARMAELSAEEIRTMLDLILEEI